MRFNSTIILLASVFMLSACGKPKAACTGEDAQKLIAQIITENAEKEIGNTKNNDNSSMFDSAKVRATLAQIKLTIEDIRTTKQDPNSSKMFCAGNLKIVIPATLLNDAEKGRELAKVSKLSQHAQQLGLESSADTFSKTIEYSVQPTDDGKQMFAELENVKPISNMLDEIVSASLLKPLLEAQKIEQDQLIEQGKVEAAHQAAQLKVEEDNQLAQQKQANLEKAKADNALTNQKINEVWTDISEDTKKMILAQQRAWIKKKTIDCNLAAGKLTDVTDKEITRLTCDSNATNLRIDALEEEI